MKSQRDTSIGKKTYVKPAWQKQEIFERFTLSCSGLGTIKASTVTNCTRLGS